MATEKYFVFSESGELKRMKGRIVRFLDNEDPTGSDKDAIRTSLEVSPDAAGLVQADVGTAPNEIPVNGMLGDMAYQSSDGLSVGTLTASGKTTLTNDSDNALVVEATNKNPMYVNVVGSAPNYLFDVRDDDTSKFRVDGAGRVGIGTATPGSFALGANELVVGDGAAGRGITVYGSPSTGGALYFADGTTGTEKERGFIYYNHAADEMRLGTAADTRWTINSSGNLVANGTAIDFGSTTTGTGTVSGGLLDDYETGTFTPTLTPTISGSITLDTGFDTLSYTKVGRLVTINGQLKIYSVSSPVGQTTMSLPFTIRSIDNVDYSNNFGGAISYFSSSASAFQTTVYNGNNGNAYIYIPLPSFIGNDQLRFSFSFLAA